MNQTLITSLIVLAGILVMMYLLKMHMKKVNTMLEPKTPCNLPTVPGPSKGNNNDSNATMKVSSVLEKMGVTQIN